MDEMMRILNTYGKMGHYLETHNRIAVAVSGGSDSAIIVHIIATYFREYLPKIKFIFNNTGLEFDATKRYLKELENKYNITIIELRGESVVYAVKKYGVPVISKSISEIVDGYIRNLPWAIKRFNRTKEDSPVYYLRDNQKQLIEYCKKHNINISSKCCDVSKKKPAFDYCKHQKIDLYITGERQAEGGMRATAHTSCYEQRKTHPWDKYMPLWFWSDSAKQIYKDAEGIKYSDCYEIWGLKRTGCVGCPFNSRVGDELKIIEKYEPKMYKACLNVFGESYRLMDMFSIRKNKILPEFSCEETKKV